MDINVTNPKTNAEQAARACRDKVVNALKSFISLMTAHVTTYCTFISAQPRSSQLISFLYSYQDGCVFGADVQVYCADADGHEEIDEKPEPVIPKVP